MTGEIYVRETTLYLCFEECHILTLFFNSDDDAEFLQSDEEEEMQEVPPDPEIQIQGSENVATSAELKLQKLANLLEKNPQDTFKKVVLSNWDSLFPEEPILSFENEETNDRRK